ncbi:MAG: PAS domain S-box protein [Candidatus Scalindua sp.]|nr:PAS domain S-box protein [Candidatus Scalindua sp.]
MKKDKSNKANNTDLRNEAEKILKHVQQPVEMLTDTEARELAHELQVHQIELEMQNEELRKVQIEIEESRSQYAHLYDFAPVGYFTISDEGIILQANLTGATMLGIERSLLIKIPLPKFIAREDQDKYYRYRRHISETNDHKSCELKMVKKDGTQFYAQLECTVAQDIVEGPKKCMTAITDITERKKAEEEIKQLNESLEQRVTESMAELIKANDELVKMQKLESVGILAGGIAHDFNNYLQGILSINALLLARTDVSTESYKYLIESDKTILLAKALTQQLLTFSKGGNPIKKTMSISELLLDTANLTQSGSNVRCEFDIPEDLWKVEADKGQMGQVISNLFINADQAMSEGGTIKVKAENIYNHANELTVLNKEKYVKLTIEDQGIGIHEKDLQKVFDPYFTTRQKGNGLGLAVSYSIIRKHEGSICVDSQMGIGTTFSLYLPASGKKTFGETEESRPGPTVGKDVKETIRLTRKKVLYMDDETIVGTTVALGLEDKGYEVELVGNGTEAVSLYKSAHFGAGKAFDAVILDLTIPDGMGGVETVRKLLMIDPDVKAIVASGYSNDTVMTSFKEYGFKGVVEKPFGIHELDQVLQTVINGVDK